MKFFVGIHCIAHVNEFPRSFVSVNVLQNRKSDFYPNEWVLDSGAFSQISRNGYFTMDVRHYANYITRWSRCGTLLAAVSQDWMCEPWIVEQTGLSVEEHQQRSTESYRLLTRLSNTYILPVLQGYAPDDYVRHLHQYGFSYGQWVGVGSICKRNGSPQAIRSVLSAVKGKRPDLKLHGFGLKRTALSDPTIRAMLYSADSMAWSFAARKSGRDANSWREAKAFQYQIEEEPCQLPVALWSTAPDMNGRSSLPSTSSVPSV